MNLDRAVRKNRVLPAGAAEVWDCLTSPERLARWFADTDRFEAGETTRLEFGDGDFFEATVQSLDPPHRLVLAWRFMKVGRPHQITWLLRPAGEGTALSLCDRGSV